MLGNPSAANIKEQLQALSERRIEMHCQIVLVPGQNDGAELRNTINDLRQLWPAVQSVAVVPVGLTSHRERLPKLRVFTRAEARQVVDYLLPESRRFRQELGVSFAYLADEWFVLAGSLVPRRSYYDDFPQIENGVGLLRILEGEAASVLRRSPRALPKPRRVIWVTGLAAAGALRRLAEQLNRVDGLWVDVLPVENSLFGRLVTVAGLLPGKDVLAALRRANCEGGTVLVPDVMIRAREQDFLDDLKFTELQQFFPETEVMLTPTNGRDLVQNTLGRMVDQCQ
jgi:putative radical SAM enzyme (TIGR03279 family)